MIPDSKLIISNELLHKVESNLYGSFAEHLGKCIYGGIWVGKESSIPNLNGLRLDAIKALKDLQLPVLRWPGGCFADNYHWMDGIGPQGKRPSRLNIWWNQPENNEFGTHEFMEFCEQINTEPYICLNVGSGTVEEARSWIEYCNSNQNTTLVQMRRENGRLDPYRVKYWGIGNENWMCGGHMRPEYYADLYKRFATYLRKTGGDEIKLIACGSYPSFEEWDERFLNSIKGAENLVNYIALHIYTGWIIPNLLFEEKDYYKIINDINIMKSNIKRAIEFADSASSQEHKIGVIMDEWGTWYKEATVGNGLFQQNTMLDAIFTAKSFHMFHEFENLYMTNMAQTANVLQALILTRGDQLVKTPTYYVFELFKPHRNSILIRSDLEQPGFTKDIETLSASVTYSEINNEYFITLVNLDTGNLCDIEITFPGKETRVKEIKQISAGQLSEYNDFDKSENIKIETIDTSIFQNSRILLKPLSITAISFN